MKILMLMLFLLLPLGVYAQRDRDINRPYERTYRQYIIRGDGITDDTEALNAWGRGERVIYQGRVLDNILQNGNFLITRKVRFNRFGSVVRFNTFIRKYTKDRNILDFGYRVRHYQNRIVDERPRFRIGIRFP